mmetsp:Transcript_16629/g.32208  ORF Transcript_16629/g.32208 Transcript_16629/m.32208 type:complete len:242 (-) Transcript_16629:869-1594(-)|eukprot:CAMPEP_0171486778 /NCGR_PEP_ID=MMETSP0958-20121227/1273_1 /TAXON_ID=87120 /ORGANISM="Aurantiochytrium limacinum, Strain ATCCMYA-1381" /LENGTH=241 /DNA_ID=CAMNT_0012019683 /DNA_START=71 /DNA_END=796 /DNA_ORIENTATION=+
MARRTATPSGSYLYLGKYIALVLVLLLLLLFSSEAVPETIFEVHGVKFLDDGSEVKFKDFEGHPILIANVASKCGYTESGYQDLRAIASRYGSELVVLGAPCAQFGNQEFPEANRILDFAASKEVNFRLLELMEVNGPETNALFRFLKDQSCIDLDNTCSRDQESCSSLNGKVQCRKTCGHCREGDAEAHIRWNFEFFLVDKTGKLAQRWRTGTRLLTPEVLQVIDFTLAQGQPKQEDKEL